MSKYHTVPNDVIHDIMCYCDINTIFGKIILTNTEVKTIIESDDFLQNCLKNSDIEMKDIVNIMYNKYNKQIVFSGLHNGWLEFKNHRYREMENNYIASKMINFVIDIYEKFIYNARIKNEQKINSFMKEFISKKSESCRHIILKLKNIQFRRQLMKWSKEKFFESKFETDINKNILCFTNGVFDFNEYIFRPGRFEDAITMCTGYDYEEYTWDNKNVIDCIDYINKVFIDQDIISYALTKLFLIISGRKHTKTFDIGQGNGCNSKSCFSLLIKEVLGDYITFIPSTTYPITQLSKSRLALLSTYEQISSHSIKQILSVCDLLLFCNKIPPINNINDIINNFNIIEFKSTFSNDCPKTLEEQMQKRIFPSDVNFYDKINSLVKPFMWIIIQQYSKTINQSFVPGIIADFTYRYYIQNDPFQIFIHNQLQSLTDRKYISTDDFYNLYKSFKFWYTKNFDNYLPSIVYFKNRMLHIGFSIIS